MKLDWPKSWRYNDRNSVMLRYRSDVDREQGVQAMSWFCDDSDGPSFYSWKEPKARKAYSCCECDAPIRTGERYFVVTGKWEGGISRFRQHLLCLETCMYIRDNITNGECVGFGTLWEFWTDCRQKNNKPEVIKLRNLLAQIRKRERSVAV